MTSPKVTFANGDDASGMAMMLGGLLEDNLRDYPGRARVTSLARGDVVLTASDRDISVTLSLRGDEVVVANGPKPGAAVLAGPWLEMAKLCSGQVNPFRAVAQRDLSIRLGRRLDAVAAAGYALSIPASFYRDEDDDEEAHEQRRQQVVIAIAVVALAATTGVIVYRRRRATARASASSMR